MKDVILDRLTLLGHVGVGLAAGQQIDGSAVAGRTDRVRKKGTVVAGIVPGHAAVIESVLPHVNRELDRFDRRLAVEYNSLAVGFDLLAAPRPQIGIPKGRPVAESMGQCL